MTTTQLESAMLILANQWRKKAQMIEDKFQQLGKVQTEIAVESIKSCAQDLEDEVKFFRSTRPLAK